MIISDTRSRLSDLAKSAGEASNKDNQPIKAYPAPIKKNFFNRSAQNDGKTFAAIPTATSSTHKSTSERPRSASQKLEKFIKTIRESKFKWQPEQQFNICADPSDQIIKNGAKTHRNERNIPLNNCFNIADLSGSNALGKLDQNSRLTLHGHGNTQAVYGKNARGDEVEYSAEKLAKFLCDSGLKEVGVLKIKACDVGKGQFLEKLVLSLTHRGVKVGYVSAPTGSHSDIRTPMKMFGKRFNLAPVPGFSQGVMKGPLPFPVPEKFGLKTVKGNVEGLSFHKTRYTA